MFHPGDYVVYGESGVCRVEDVGTPSFVTPEAGKTYYFLRAADYEGMIYAPVDTRIPMRAPINREQADQLLGALRDMPVSAPQSRDRKIVTQHYQQIMREHTYQGLALTVKSIYQRHQSAAGEMSRLSSTEEGILKKAERQLCAELAAALDTTPEGAKKALLSALRTDKEAKPLGGLRE